MWKPIIVSFLLVVIGFMYLDMKTELGVLVSNIYFVGAAIVYALDRKKIQ